MHPLRFVLAFVAACTMAFSQQISAQDTLTSDRAVELALAHHYGIRIAKNEAAISANNVTKGNAGMLPEVNLVSGIGLSNSINARLNLASGDAIVRNFAGAYNGNAGVVLNWTIFDGRRMYIAYDRLEAQQKLSEQELRVQIEQTTSEVLLAWTNAIVQQEYIRSIKRNLDFYDERIRLAQVRVDAGSIPKTTLLQTQVDKNVQNSALLNAENTLALQKIALIRLLGLAPDANLLFPVNFSASANYALETLQNWALQDNSLLRLQQQNSVLAAFAVKELETLYKPRIGLNAGYNVNLSGTQAGFVTSTQNHGVNAGINLSWNLFNGRNTSRQIQNAKLQVQNAEWALAQAKADIATNIASAFASFQNALALEQLEQANLALAKENLDIAQARFRISGAEILSVKEAQKSYEDATLRQINARFQAKVNEIRMLALCGRIGG